MAETKKQIFLWSGENDLERHEELGRWLRRFEEKYHNFNIVILDAEGTDLSKAQILTELKNALQVNSLFGANKLIVLKNFLKAKKSKKSDDDEVQESGGSEYQEVLTTSLDNLADGCFLIFSQVEKPNETLKLVKKLNTLVKSGRAEKREFSLPQGSALVSWVEQKVKGVGCQVSRGDAEFLIALVGQDLWQLQMEIDKLTNYKKNDLIARADIAELVKAKFQDDIFALMDAISRRDHRVALNLMQQQLNSGSNEMYLLSMLVRQFRLLREVKEVYESGNRDKSLIASRLAIHPFAVQKLLTQINLFNFEQLTRLYRELMEIEFKMKSQSPDFLALFAKWFLGL